MKAYLTLFQPLQVESKYTCKTLWKRHRRWKTSLRLLIRKRMADGMRRLGDLQETKANAGLWHAGAAFPTASSGCAHCRDIDYAPVPWFGGRQTRCLWHTQCCHMGLHHVCNFPHFVINCEIMSESENNFGLCAVQAKILPCVLIVWKCQEPFYFVGEQVACIKKGLFFSYVMICFL